MIAKGVWVPGAVKQGIDRKHRLDMVAQDEPLRAYLLHAPGTLESAVLSVLVVDSSAPPDGEDAAIATALDSGATIVVASKVDLGRGAKAQEFAELFRDKGAGRGRAVPPVLWVLMRSSKINR